MNLSPLRLIPLRWKLAGVAALSTRRPPAGFPETGPRLIVALAADYGNLGDVALTRALLQFAAAHLPAHRPYLLCAGRIFRDLKGASRAASPDDVVVIVGGGNMGDLYPDLEEARLRVVRAFPGNRIISFPQSIDFSDTPLGRSALQRSRRIYAAHPRLSVFARDAESLRRMRLAFPDVSTVLAPDTVLAMSAPNVASRTLSLAVCLRQDKEAGMSGERRSALVASLLSAHPEAWIGDTLVAGPRLSYAGYESHLDDLLARFCSARCIVTDRLHGLIFAVITGTPCVVIENSNHKIRGVVQSWLRDAESVRLLTDPDPPAVLAAVESVMAAPAVRPDLSAAFAPLAAALRG